MNQPTTNRPEEVTMDTPTKMTEFLRARDLEPGDRISIERIAREVVRVTKDEITPNLNFPRPDQRIRYRLGDAVRIQWGIRIRVELAAIAGQVNDAWFATPDDEEWDWVELEDRP